tara:strand:+ start:1226 stop:1729 length:504 start_codon:yes stop_codon:yes gene_type:complete
MKLTGDFKHYAEKMAEPEAAKLTIAFQKGSMQAMQLNQDGAYAEWDKLRKELAKANRPHDSLRTSNRLLSEEVNKLRKDLADISEYGTEEINAAVELRSLLAQSRIEADQAKTEVNEAFGWNKKLAAERDQWREIAIRLIESGEPAPGYAKSWSATCIQFIQLKEGK